MPMSNVGCKLLTMGVAAGSSFSLDGLFSVDPYFVTTSKRERRAIDGTCFDPSIGVVQRDVWVAELKCAWVCRDRGRLAYKDSECVVVANCRRYANVTTGFWA